MKYRIVTKVSRYVSHRDFRYRAAPNRSTRVYEAKPGRFESLVSYRREKNVRTYYGQLESVRVS